MARIMFEPHNHAHTPLRQPTRKTDSMKKHTTFYKQSYRQTGKQPIAKLIDRQTVKTGTEKRYRK